LNAQAEDEEKLAKRKPQRAGVPPTRASRLEAALHEVERLQREKAA